jgi:radical SAM superfamily enzyme YgiQ (UPF0313 family)
MGRVINKHLTKAQIVDAVRLIGRQEGFEIRLCFIIGLPTETHEDVGATLTKLARRLEISDASVGYSVERGK